LHGDDAESAFAPDTIAAIAAASGGDPALVNRLASRTLDAHRGDSAGPTQNLAARTAIAAQKLPPAPDPSAEMPPVLPPQDIDPPLPAPAMLSSASEIAAAPLQAPPRRRSVGRRLVIGTIVALAYFGVLLVLGSFIPRYFRPSDDIPAATEQRPASSPSKAQAERRPSVTSAEPSAAPALQTPASAGTGATPDTNPATVERSTKTETPAAAALNATESAGSPASPPSSPAAAGAASAPAMPDTSAVPDAALPASPGSAESAASAQIDSATDEVTIALIARGDQFLTTGDIVSARLYYERAANAGNGHAALLMGETFDPAFLGRAGVRGVRGDADAAAAWYRRARDLGDRDAERRFEILESK